MGKYDKQVTDNDTKQKSAKADAKELLNKRMAIEKEILLEANKVFESLIRPELNEAKVALGKGGHEAIVSHDTVTHSNHGITVTTAIRIEARSVISTDCKLEFQIGAVGSARESSIFVNLNVTNAGNIIHQDHPTKALDQQTIEKYVTKFIDHVYNPPKS
jgi:hypothetical protein